MRPSEGDYDGSSLDACARAARILDTHGNAILRYAYSYLHNMEDAEEVLQDTLVQFLRTAPAFESESHEKAWLLRVAGNLSKNRLSYNAVRAKESRTATRSPSGRTAPTAIRSAYPPGSPPPPGKRSLRGYNKWQSGSAKAGGSSPVTRSKTASASRFLMRAIFPPSSSACSHNPSASCSPPPTERQKGTPR